MLNVVQLEEIKGLLLRVPKLVDKLEKRDPQFAVAVRTWSTQVEEVLTHNHMAVTADVAALRGVLISVERGLIPEGIVFRGRATVRKVRDATAADVLRKVESIIADAIRADMAQLDEGRRLARQIVTVAQRKGLIAPQLHAGEHTQVVSAIWQAIISDAELAGPAVHLAGLVGTHDALALVDQMLPTLRV